MAKRVRAKKHIRTHSVLYTIIVMGFLATLISSIWSYHNMSGELELSTTKQIEQSSLTQLDVFHRGTVRLTEVALNNAASVISKLAKEPGVINRINSGNYASLTPNLAVQRNINQNFNSLSVLDSNGILRSLATDLPNPEKYLGTDYTSYLNIKYVLENHKPTLGSKITAKSGRSVITFTAPVIDSSNRFIGIIAGTMTMEGLAKRTILGSSLTNFQSALVDWEGNLLLENGMAINDSTNLKGQSHVFDTLKSGNQSIRDQEINYRGIKAFTEGSTINVSDFGSVAVISFYPQSTYEHQINIQKQVFNHVYSYHVIRSICIYIVVVLIIALVIRREQTQPK